jgi:hypothetical protein
MPRTEPSREDLSLSLRHLLIGERARTSPTLNKYYQTDRGQELMIIQKWSLRMRIPSLVAVLNDGWHKNNSLLVSVRDLLKVNFTCPEGKFLHPLLKLDTTPHSHSLL